MYVLYYASMLRCWHLVCILVRTDHPCLGLGCHTYSPTTVPEMHVDVSYVAPQALQIVNVTQSILQVSYLYFPKGGNNSIMIRVSSGST
jgi:hypothetical protein